MRSARSYTNRGLSPLSFLLCREVEEYERSPSSGVRGAFSAQRAPPARGVPPVTAPPAGSCAPSRGSRRTTARGTAASPGRRTSSLPPKRTQSRRRLSRAMQGRRRRRRRAASGMRRSTSFYTSTDSLPLVSLGPSKPVGAPKSTSRTRSSSILSPTTSELHHHHCLTAAPEH